MNTNTYILMNSLLHTIYIIVNNIFFVSLSLSEALSQLMTVSYVHMLIGQDNPSLSDFSHVTWHEKMIATLQKLNISLDMLDTVDPALSSHSYQQPTS